ncbi:hypothetical protein HHK36_020874 [Tetracentron sinense]|uniref:TRF2/HOY1 PH-like domain-containing protein n=1 Tax=Tetracentron sinense TaxID=13715 RepID=A0A834YYF3_TETSI|nr:hypothetical protein HHK36_020874 [Tetracentron sinense]
MEGVSTSDEFQNPLYGSNNGKNNGGCVFKGSKADSMRIKLMEDNHQAILADIYKTRLIQRIWGFQIEKTMKSWFKDLGTSGFCFGKDMEGVSASNEFQNPLYGSNNGKNNGGCAFEGSEADSKRIKLMEDNHQVLGSSVDFGQEGNRHGCTVYMGLNMLQHFFALYPFAKESGLGGVSAPDEFQNTLFGSDNCKNNGGCVFEGSEADSKRIKLMGDNYQGEAFLNLSREPSTLGLILKRTPSFLDLIEKLSQRSETTLVETNRSTNHEKARTRNDFAAQPITEKLKASNIPASLLKIGSWERVSKYEGELVAKCYYAKRKLVWEVLEGALKSKIEVQWSDISAIRAVFPENEPGILEIELNNAPLFFREMDPQPRKHTLWQAISDFTGCQAPIYRRHFLKFPKGTLDRHYEKLLQCDDRLFMLSQRPFPTSNSPYFESSPRQEFRFAFNGREPGFSPSLQYPHPCIPRPTLGHSCQVQNFEPAFRPPTGAEDSTSPMSVMNFPPIEHQRASFSIPTRFGNHIREPPLIASAAQVSHGHPRGGSYLLLNSVEGSGRPPSNNHVLNNIADLLLNDTLGECFDEQRLFSRVNSMSLLIGASNEVSPIETASTEYGHYNNTNTHFVPGSTEQFNGENELPCLQPANENPMYIPGNTSNPNIFIDQWLEEPVNEVLALPLPHRLLFPGFYLPIYVKLCRLISMYIWNIYLSTVHVKAIASGEAPEAIASAA